MSATILYVKHLVDGRGAEGGPGPGLRLLHALLRPVAYAGREDGLQPCALLRAERHLVIVHVDRLELALDDVDTERRARHQLGRQPDREQRDTGIPTLAIEVTGAKSAASICADV